MGMPVVLNGFDTGQNSTARWLRDAISETARLIGCSPLVVFTNANLVNDRETISIRHAVGCSHALK